MAKQYEGLLNNPNVRSMLNLIAQAEGVKWGYNTLFGNQKIDNLSAHPNIKKQFKQTDGKTNYTTAAGRYQFLKGTWDGLARQHGLNDFSPRSQDIGAIALLAENGALPYVLKGDYQTAVKKSGTTWASLPSSNYAQPKRGWDFVNKQLGGNIGNIADVSPNFVDLKVLGYKTQPQAASMNNQPEFVDLKQLGYQQSASTDEPKPQFVDLKTLGYGA